MVAQTRGPERVSSRILRIVFQEEANAQRAWKDCDFKSRSDIIKACKDPETLKRMRWKDYPDNKVELMSEEQIEHFKELPSFFNWMQNNHGTLPDHPVDVVPDNVKTLFTWFIDMDADERETPDVSGVVKYDKGQALESEKRKKLGAYADPSTTAASGGLTTPTKCRSAAANALLAFEKKLRPNEDSWTAFTNSAEWTNWKVRHAGIMTLNDVRDVRGVSNLNLNHKSGCKARRST